jgi:hypothetical protein
MSGTFEQMRNYRTVDAAGKRHEYFHGMGLYCDGSIEVLSVVEGPESATSIFM